MIGLGLGLTKARSRFLPGATLEEFERWFLASGVWDNDGEWVDRATWSGVWFLRNGRMNVFGFWNDSEAW